MCIRDRRNAVAGELVATSVDDKPRSTTLTFIRDKSPPVPQLRAERGEEYCQGADERRVSCERIFDEYEGHVKPVCKSEQ